MGGGLPHPLDVALGHRVRLLREKAGMSQAVVARQCSVSISQIQKYESARDRMSFSRLTEIASALDMSVISIIAPLVADPATASGTSEFMGYLETPYAMPLLHAYSLISDPQYRSLLLNLAIALSRTDKS